MDNKAEETWTWTWILTWTLGIWSCCFLFRWLRKSDNRNTYTHLHQRKNSELIHIRDESYERYNYKCIKEAAHYNGPRVSIYTMTSIVKALTQQNNIIFGLYGSSDASKKNVVEQMTKRVERDKVFDVVVHVMASVMKKNKWWSLWSKSPPDLRRIQGELGNKLGLQLDDKTTVEERATILCDKIKTKEKILFILDDLRDGINLAKIGIPFGNDHKGCKILLVSPSQEVLSNQMNAPQVEFCVDYD